MENELLFQICQSVRQPFPRSLRTFVTSDTPQNNSDKDFEFHFEVVRMRRGNASIDSKDSDLDIVEQIVIDDWETKSCGYLTCNLFEEVLIVSRKVLQPFFYVSLARALGIGHLRDDGLPCRWAIVVPDGCPWT
jgi:hypothetical protein